MILLLSNPVTQSDPIALANPLSGGYSSNPGYLFNPPIKPINFHTDKPLPNLISASHPRQTTRWCLKKYYLSQVRQKERTADPVQVDNGSVWANAREEGRWSLTQSQCIFNSQLSVHGTGCWPLNARFESNCQRHLARDMLRHKGKVYNLLWRLTSGDDKNFVDNAAPPQPSKRETAIERTLGNHQLQATEITLLIDDRVWYRDQMKNEFWPVF